MQCLAKAYRDRPLERSVVSRQRDLVFLALPDAQPTESDNVGAIGFPVESVFRFDQQLYLALVDAFSRNDSAALKDLWSGAEPLYAPVGAD